MANDPRTPYEKTNVVTLKDTRQIVFEGLNEYQIKQVREIVQEEIAKAIQKLIDTGVIGN